MKHFIIIVISAIIMVAGYFFLPNQTPAPDNTINRNNVDLKNVQVYFPREGQDPAEVIPALYMTATGKLDIAIYSLTHPVIVKAIGDAMKRGVAVRIITDKTQAEGNTQKHAINDLLLIGIPIKENNHTGLMHLKTSIIDNTIATTGSYNYSMGASSNNDEIFVVVKDQWFAERCEAEFNRMWQSSDFQILNINY